MFKKLFWVLSLTASLAFAKKPEITSCQLLLDKLMESIWSHSEILANPTLPEQSLPVALKKTDFQRYYTVCQDLWWTGLNRKELRDFVGEIRDGHQPTPEQEAKFKELRGRIKQLRFAYLAFDKHHEYPERLDELAVALGHLQDAFKAKQREIVVKEAKKSIELLSKDNIKKIQDELEGFEPASKKDFRKFVKEGYEELEHGLKEDEVSPKEFHEMRKVIGKQIAIYDVFNTLTPSPQTQEIVDYLGTLNGLMGNLHDELIDGSFKGTLDYDNSTMKVPPRIRRLLRGLVEHADQLTPNDKWN